MPAEPSINGRPRLAASATQSQSFERWDEIGRHALRIARPAELRRLREIIEELKALVIYEHWVANGQNNTKTAADLGIHRRSVAQAIKRRTRTPDTEGQR